MTEIKQCRLEEVKGSSAEEAVEIMRQSGIVGAFAVFERRGCPWFCEDLYSRFAHLEQRFERIAQP